LAPDCWLPDFSETFLHFIDSLQTVQNMTHATITVISHTKSHFTYRGHPFCQIGSFLH